MQLLTSYHEYMGGKGGDLGGIDEEARVVVAIKDHSRQRGAVWQGSSQRDHSFISDLVVAKVQGRQRGAVWQGSSQRDRSCANSNR